jgi:uncharacterized membrane protein
VALYGVVLFLASIAYFLLTRALIALHGKQSKLAAAVGRDFKGAISSILYLVAILIAFLLPWISVAIYVGVAILWLVPDRRIEKTLVG